MMKSRGLRRFFRRVFRVRTILIVLAVIVVSGAVFGGGFWTGRSYAPVIVSEQIIIPPANIAGFNTLIESYVLLDRYFYGELPPIEKLVEGAVEGMIEKLPPELAEFTYYHNRIRAKIVAAMMEGKFAGIGVYLTTENSQLIITALEPEGPAEKAGLKPGDVITAIDGESVIGVSWDIRHALFRGEPGTELTVSIYRIGEGNLDFRITRAVIETPSVRTKLLAKGQIGYIHLREFSATSPNEMLNTLRQLLDEEKVDGLILDLRGNPGGYQYVGVKILSQFLSGGKVALRVHYPDGRIEILTTHFGGLATETPLVVLIDEGSASASEVLAGAFQDHGRALLIGVTTHGKGVGQTTYPLSEGSIAVVDHEFRTPNGRIVHGIGIQPDIFVPTNPAQRMRGQDPALDQAIEELLKEIGK